MKSYRGHLLQPSSKPVDFNSHQHWFAVQFRGQHSVIDHQRANGQRNPACLCLCDTMKRTQSNPVIQ